MKTARKMGIASVAVYSEADKDAPQLLKYFKKLGRGCDSRHGSHAVRCPRVAHGLPSHAEVGAVLLVNYLVGLSYAARQENSNRLGDQWPSIGSL